MDLTSDQTIVLTGPKSKAEYPEPLRRVRFYDRENDRHLIFLTNNFLLPALTIAKLYKLRWQVELFFRWIKQNLRIKSFYGTSENAVRTQIWVAITIYALVAIIKKRSGPGASALQFFADFERDRVRESPIESTAYVFGRS